MLGENPCPRLKLHWLLTLQWLVAEASHAIMPHILSSTRNRTLRCERWRSERSFRTLSRSERHQAASYGAAAAPSKTMCKQTLAPPDGPERHRRFYLAVNLRPWSAPSFPPW